MATTIRKAIRSSTGSDSGSRSGSGSSSTITMASAAVAAASSSTNKRSTLVPVGMALMMFVTVMALLNLIYFSIWAGSTSLLLWVDIHQNQNLASSSTSAASATAGAASEASNERNGNNADDHKKEGGGVLQQVQQQQQQKQHEIGRRRIELQQQLQQHQKTSSLQSDREHQLASSSFHLSSHRQPRRTRRRRPPPPSIVVFYNIYIHPNDTNPYHIVQEQMNILRTSYASSYYHGLWLSSSASSSSSSSRSSSSRATTQIQQQQQQIQSSPLAHEHSSSSSDKPDLFRGLPVYYNTIGSGGGSTTQQQHTNRSSSSSFVWDNTYMEQQLCGGGGMNHSNNNESTQQSSSSSYSYPLHCIHKGHYAHGFEEITLQDMHNYCQQQPPSSRRNDFNNPINRSGMDNDDDMDDNRFVIYIHNKGSYRRDVKNQIWRQFLTQAVVSKECIDAMTTTTTTTRNSNQKSTCGLQFLPFLAWMYGGNMFVAKCSYIQKLVSPQSFLINATRTVQASETKEMKSNLQNFLFNPDAVMMGLGRYAMEEWPCSHPTFTPCDVSIPYNVMFWWKHPPNTTTTSSSSMISKPPAATTTSTSTTTPNNLYQFVVHCGIRHSYNDTYGKWLRMLGPKFLERVQKNKSMRIRESHLLPGYLFRWHYIYPNQFPYYDSWIWSFYPDGIYWRNLIYPNINETNITTTMNGLQILQKVWNETPLILFDNTATSASVPKQNKQVSSKIQPSTITTAK